MSIEVINGERLRKEYDQWHRRNFEAGPEHEDASSPWYLLVREYLGDVSGLRVLEVACGRGGFSRQLAVAGAYVTGCDFSFSAVRITDGKLRGAQDRSGGGAVQGDAQNLPFVDNAFDVVISCETIEHLPDVQSGVREMYRVARQGGKLFLTTPNYLNFMGLYELYAKLRHPDKRDDQPYDRRQWFPQVRRWVRRAGWKILTSDGTVHQFPVLPGHNPIRWQGLESNRTVRKLLSPVSYTYFIEAVKG